MRIDLREDQPLGTAGPLASLAGPYEPPGDERRPVYCAGLPASSWLSRVERRARDGRELDREVQIEFGVIGLRRDAVVGYDEKPTIATT